MRTKNSTDFFVQQAFALMTQKGIPTSPNAGLVEERFTSLKENYVVFELFEARWFEKVLRGLKDYPQLAGSFLLNLDLFFSPHLISGLEADDEMSFHISRMFETVLPRIVVEEGAKNPFGGTLSTDVFQLDEKACIALAEAVLDGWVGGYIKTIKLKNLPFEYAEKLFRQFGITESKRGPNVKGLPLILAEPYYRTEFLQELVEIYRTNTGYIHPNLLISNPYLSDEEFNHLIELSHFSYNIRDLELASEKRWLALADYLAEQVASDDVQVTRNTIILDCLLENKCLPQSAIDLIHNKLPQQRFRPSNQYAAVDLLLVPEARKQLLALPVASIWSITDNFTNSKQVEDYYRLIDGKSTAELLLGSPWIPANLFTEIMVEYPQLEKDFENAYWSVNYNEDNPWNTKLDSIYYHTVWNEEEKAAYEKRVDGFLVSSTVSKSDLVDIPMTWKLQMLEMTKCEWKRGWEERNDKH